MGEEERESLGKEFTDWPTAKEDALDRTGGPTHFPAHGRRYSTGWSSPPGTSSNGGSRPTRSAVTTSAVPGPGSPACSAPW